MSRAQRANRVYLQWHLTNKCRNRCRHCYQLSYDGVDITTKEAISIIEDFLYCCNEFDALPVIALTGGDPMLNQDFWSIIKEIKKRAQIDCVSVLGNPEQINKENIEKLKPFNLKHFQLSLDGTELTHDYFRYKGSFKRTIQAIEDLSENGIPVYVMSTISYQNYLEMPEVMEIAYEHGATHWMFARWIPSKGDCGIFPGDYIKFVKRILQKHRKYEKSGYKRLRKEPLIARFQDKLLLEDQIVVSGGCGMGSSTITMLPDKTLMACRCHPKSVIGKWSLKENFLYHFLNNPEMNKYRKIERIENCNKCALLKFCRGCRAAAYVASGKEFQKDPQCPGPVYI